MSNGYSPLSAEIHITTKTTLSELVELFAPWVELPERFGHNIRDRLFSPLTDVLAVPVSGVCRRSLVHRGAEQVSRLVGLGTRTNRQPQHRRLL